MSASSHPRHRLAPYPVQVAFPDITRWRQGTDGVDYLHRFDSGEPGPHVMISALVHGNEVSGALALDTLLSAGLRPRRGQLSLVFVNVQAYAAFNPEDADATRFLDEDLNRVWLDPRLDGTEHSRELARARELRPWVRQADLLLDIHSMHEASAPLMMCGPTAKGRALAARLGAPATVIVDAGHANGRRLRDYGDFADEASPRNALLVETGQHFAAHSEAVAMDTALRFLLMAGTVDEQDVAHWPLLPLPATQRFLEVTQPVVARTEDFRFVEDFKGLETIEKAGTVIAYDGGQPVVTPHDHCVLIQPSLRQLAPGVTVVRLAREVAQA
ncbi:MULTISPECIES: succinylglutamate desuccinylase/aspartoacylase family protein [unclassified Pseudomonas]|uniref:succinylglutamate desuccinylase/aspartoacylase domain-containing protein n=1 Tax=unclassified Pseudomonas TaxID=196821 RepID=UPI000BD25812|nr:MULTISPECIES: succinylglutamate desuccinylase/aspartoacylase family protein [unclassified Pseudomonas]PVZ16516.1 putative deacylase [Pseudomonas sp. URIL14HWK12:I12]PVZ25628.1 putative deacylase [Pseudomonas sp. URIL14HWK12:I10]PVZ36848.1 putative deacylase [Pseudomonas sp. URIL14HWK12:I11]SNZ12491.1 Predicted deacylase [Pseudomonas sp. URIL14HWK12:I9]